MWNVSGIEFNVLSKDGIITNKGIIDCIDLISGAVNGAYQCFENQTFIESEWNKQSECHCVLAKDYFATTKLKENKYLNNIKSIIESWIKATEPGSIVNKVIEILNCRKLSTVLTHYGYYDTIIEIQKLMSLDISKPTPPNIIEAIAGTEQFDLISLEFFQSHISDSNAFNMIIINNEFNFHCKRVTELLFYRLYGDKILIPNTWKVKSSINNCDKRYHKAMFRKLQFYHEIDHLHNNHREQHIVWGYFRKNQKHFPMDSVYYTFPIQAMFICWSYYHDHKLKIQSIQQSINDIPKHGNMSQYNKFNYLCNTGKLG